MDEKQIMCGQIGFGGWCESNYGHHDAHKFVSKEERLTREIREVLNRHSAENASNTPDFILAQYLFGCLAAWNTAVQQRETWYGRNAQPTATESNCPIVECDVVGEHTHHVNGGDVKAK